MSLLVCGISPALFSQLQTTYPSVKVRRVDGERRINEWKINRKALDPSLIPPTGHFRHSQWALHASLALLLSLMDWAYATLIPHKFDNNCMRLVLSVSSGAGIFCGGGSPSPVLLSDGTSGGVSPVVQQLHSLDVDVFSRSKWPSCTVECWLPPFMCGRKCASNKYVSDVRRRLIFLIKCFTPLPFQLTSCYLCVRQHWMLLGSTFSDVLEMTTHHFRNVN